MLDPQDELVAAVQVTVPVPESESVATDEPAAEDPAADVSAAEEEGAVR